MKHLSPLAFVFFVLCAVPVLAEPVVALAVAKVDAPVPPVAVPPVAAPSAAVPSAAVPPVAAPSAAVPPVAAPPVAAPPAAVPPVVVPPVPQPIPQPVIEVWEMMLQTRLKELDVIYAEAKALQNRLSASTKVFSESFQQVEQDYQRVIAVAQVSRGLPVELSVVDENLRRLQDQLSQLLRPLEGALTSLQDRLNDMIVFDKGADGTEDKDAKNTLAASESPQIREFLTRRDQTQRLLNQLQNRIRRVLEPARKLSEDMTKQKQNIETVLPNLWRAYYLTPSGRLYNFSSWVGLSDSVSIMQEAFSLRLNAEMPSTPSEWYTVLARMVIVLVPLHLMLLFVRRAILKKSLVASKGWERLTRHSLPWLATGLALHFSAWSPAGDAYQVLAVLGTFLMSMGQLALAWDLYTFDHPKSSTRSELIPLITPLAFGLILLLLNLPAPALGLLWLLIIGLFLWRDRLRVRPEDQTPLVSNLLGGHVAILWVAAIMTVLGWGRLSILVCMGYAALSVIIQQAIGFMRLASSISAQLPEKGPRALIGGVVLALAVPTVLVVVTLSTGLWILAYPGGAALLDQMALLDISVGRTSFNMLQLLFIISAFYVTRSVIVVGSTFLRELPSNGVSMDQNLLGPIQVAYTYILWALFGLYALSALGFSLTSLAVVAGGLSVGIGFGLQNIINNFVSGLLVIFGQTLREGDVIEVGNLTGTVKRINVRSTMVETADNAVIFVPNAEFLSGRLTNWTSNGRMVRREIRVGVAYGSDVAQVIKTLHTIAGEHRSVLKYPEPMVLFDDFGSSTLDFILRFWVADIVHALPILTDLRVEIERCFREGGIEIAYPQMDIHLKRENTFQSVGFASKDRQASAQHLSDDPAGTQAEASEQHTTKSPEPEHSAPEPKRLAPEPKRLAPEPSPSETTFSEPTHAGKS